VILVVDDDASIRCLLEFILTDAGYGVRHSHSAESALSGLDDTVQLVITDLGMPGRDGFWLTERLRERRANLPVLMVTAHGDTAAARWAEALGVSGFLTKPFSRLHVLNAVHTLLKEVPGDAKVEHIEPLEV
jgi:two-component system, NtrC family, response regulator AtoC